MPVDIQCDDCGHVHQIPDRRFVPESGGTVCPNCGGRSYTVRRHGLTWHP